MGIFKKRITAREIEEAYPVADFSPQLTEARKREISIEYINGLSKRELELFLEGAQLIWQGYGILNRVKTPAEKMEEKQAKEEEALDLTSDDDIAGFLDLDGNNGTK